MKAKAILVAGIHFWANHLQGETYWVAPGGSDGGPGTFDSPWLTIQRAADLLQPGDSVTIRSGTYHERVTTKRGGSAGSGRIVFTAEGTVVMKGWIISHPHVTVDGFEITGHSALSTSDAHVKVNSGGSHFELLRCSVRDGIQGARSDMTFHAATSTIESPNGSFLSERFAPGQTLLVGGAADDQDTVNDGVHVITAVTDNAITVQSPLANDGPLNIYLSASYAYGLQISNSAADCVFRSNTFSNLAYDTWFILGARHLFEDNIIERCNGWDAMHFGGSDHVFRGNVIRNSPLLVYQTSPDAMENYSPTPYSNVLFERNFIHGFVGVLASQKGSNTSTGLRYRNNVFVDSGRFSLTHPNTRFENNTFLRIARLPAIPGILSRASHPLFVSAGVGATGAEIRNNVFVDCGFPLNSQSEAQVGWYEISGSTATITTVGNFVAGSSPAFGPKTGFNEVNPALNGGDPGFVDMGNPLGPDGLPFTEDDGLQLRPDSKLHLAGAGMVTPGAYGTTNDSDDDRMEDWWELEHFETLDAEPGDDPDEDGLDNLAEHDNGTDPNKGDTDGDGLSDSAEIAHGTDPLKADTDGDGLIDSVEIALGTDPHNPDTDGDGLSDSAEVAAGTDPLKADTDGDGLSDFDEIALGTDPRNPDTDGDGFVDGADYDPFHADGILTSQFFRVRSDSEDMDVAGFTPPGHLTVSDPSGTGEFLIERSPDLKIWKPYARDTLQGLPVAVKVFDPDTEPGMRFVPGGRFMMGDSFGEAINTHGPSHQVLLDSFFMAAEEVDNRQFQTVFQWAFDQGLIVVSGGNILDLQGTVLMALDLFAAEIGFTGSTFTVVAGREDYPCAYVSWYGAVSYCNFLSLMEGRDPCYDLANWTCDFSRAGYRLPTEAEWEYAARGGLEGKRFPWGDLITHSEANYRSSEENAYDVSPTRDFHPTYANQRPRSSRGGSFAPNGFGLFDMCGGVLEWNWDWYDRYRDTDVLHINPTGPGSGTRRIVRGGSWFTTAERATSYFRFSFIDPDRTITDVGFRVVLPDLPE